MYWWIANPVRLVIPVNSQGADDMDRRRSVDHRGAMRDTIAFVRPQVHVK